MGCCCIDDAGKNPIPISQRRCCICNPFRNDGYIMTSQICSIVAACLSWLWWPTFVLSLPILVLCQVIWCCKMRKRGLLATAVLSFFAFCTALFTGIYMIVACWDTLFVLINRRTLYSYPEDYDYNYSYTSSHWYDDWCHYHNTVAWAVVAFVDAILYLIICISMYRFVRVRYDDVIAKLEEEYCNENATTDAAAIPSASIVGNTTTDREAYNFPPPMNAPTEARVVEMAPLDNGVQKADDVGV